MCSYMYVLLLWGVNFVALSKRKKKKKASKSHKGGKGKQSSEPSVLEVLPKHLDFDRDVEAWASGQFGSSNVDKIEYVVHEEHLPLILCDWRWGDRITVHIPQANEKNFQPQAWFFLSVCLSIYLWIRTPDWSRDPRLLSPFLYVLGSSWAEFLEARDRLSLFSECGWRRLLSFEIFTTFSLQLHLEGASSRWWVGAHELLWTQRMTMTGVGSSDILQSLLGSWFNPRTGLFWRLGMTNVSPSFRLDYSFLFSPFLKSFFWFSLYLLFSHAGSSESISDIKEWVKNIMAASPIVERSRRFISQASGWRDKDHVKHVLLLRS